MTKPRRKLTSDQAQMAVDLYYEGGFSAAQIARHLGIEMTVAWRIIRGQTYKETVLPENYKDTLNKRGA